MPDGNIRRKRDRAVCLLGATLLLFLLPLSLARADVAEDWTRIALFAAISSRQQTVPTVRAMAMMHVAMFETMNFIERRYVPRFIVKPPQPVNISSLVAGAAAAHFVLVRLYPEQEAMLDARLQRSIAGIPDADKSSALETGKALAANIYAVWVSSPGAPVYHSEADYVLSYWTVAWFTEAGGVGALESARLHALVSMALGELHGAERLCVPCASGAAVQAILESASESMKAARITPTLAVASAGSRHASIEADEKLGRTIGLRAAASYRPAGTP